MSNYVTKPDCVYNCTKQDQTWGQALIPNTSAPSPQGDTLVTYKNLREGKKSEGMEKECGIRLDINGGS